MATSQELKPDQENHYETIVHEKSPEGMPERFHELGEELRAAHHYEDVRARAEELGGNPELVTALNGAAGVVKDAVADIQRQRALAEEMGPFPKKDSQEAPHNSSHN